MEKGICVLSVLLFFTYSAAYNSSLFLEQKIKLKYEELTKITNLIIENTFAKQFSSVNIITAVQFQRDRKFQDLKESLLRLNKGTAAYQLDHYIFLKDAHLRKKKNIVIFLDKLETFTLLQENINPETIDYRGRFVIVLVYGWFKGINKIFEIFWRKGILNVFIVFPTDADAVQILTFYPYRLGGCDDATPLQWNIIQNGTFTTNTGPIFADKTQNLYGCPINVITFDACPAVCIQKDKNLSLVGYEWEILKIIAKMLNFRIVESVFKGDNQLGTVFQNATVTGALHFLINGQAQIAIGNFALRQARIKNFDHSIVFLTMPIVLAIPRGELLTDLEKLLQPLNLTVWILNMTTLIFALIVIAYLSFKVSRLRKLLHEAGTGDPTMNLFGAILGVGQPKLPTSNFARIILITLLMFCLIQRNVYQGSMYEFLQTDGRHMEVQSFKEIVEKNFTIYALEDLSKVVKGFDPNYLK